MQLFVSGVASLHSSCVASQWWIVWLSLQTEGMTEIWTVFAINERTVRDNTEKKIQKRYSSPTWPPSGRVTSAPPAWMRAYTHQRPQSLCFSIPPSSLYSRLPSLFIISPCSSSSPLPPAASVPPTAREARHAAVRGHVNKSPVGIFKQPSVFSLPVCVARTPVHDDSSSLPMRAHSQADTQRHLYACLCIYYAADTHRGNSAETVEDLAEILHTLQK